MRRLRLPDFSFCPFCGGTRLEPDVSRSCWHCPDCQHAFFVNSKPSVCAVIVRRDQILLVSDSPDARRWDFPGGFLRYGEKPEEGLQRELWEELGVEAKIGRLLAAKVDTYASESDFSLNLFYDTQLESEVLRPAGEVTAAQWFPWDRLPRIKFASTKQVILSLRGK
jgi:ADP-ribose pyrophosphatase YjhB (NUDIX family)